jgi:hypothetical protein
MIGKRALSLAEILISQAVDTSVSVVIRTVHSAREIIALNRDRPERHQDQLARPAW